MCFPWVQIMWLRAKKRCGQTKVEYSSGFVLNLWRGGTNSHGILLANLAWEKLKNLSFWKASSTSILLKLLHSFEMLRSLCLGKALCNYSDYLTKRFLFSCNPSLIFFSANLSLWKFSLYILIPYTLINDEEASGFPHFHWSKKQSSNMLFLV